MDKIVKNVMIIVYYVIKQNVLNVNKDIILKDNYVKNVWINV